MFNNLRVLLLNVLAVPFFFRAFRWRRAGKVRHLSLPGCFTTWCLGTDGPGFISCSAWANQLSGLARRAILDW